MPRLPPRGRPIASPPVSPRRIKLRGSDQRLVLAVGAATGVGLALRGLSPTGAPFIDWILLIVASIGAVWAAASAPWWALSGLAGTACALAEPWLPILIGAGVFALSLGIGATRRSQPVERAVVAGASMLVLSMMRNFDTFGLSTAISLALVAATMVLGLRRRSRKERRTAMVVAGTTATLAIVAGLGFLAAGVSARPDLSDGNRAARQGLRELKSGEFELAQVSFDRAANAFDRAEADLSSPWAQPARLLPIASQHRRAGQDIAAAAGETANTIEKQLAVIDFDALTIRDGSIDIAAVEALQQPMAELQSSLEDLESAIVDADDPWLVGPVRDRLDSLSVEIDEQRDLGAKANDALAIAPAMLGTEGERVYFVMFTTPAEARGQGGFMGNWAEVTVDDGHLEMTAFGRTADLNSGGDRHRILTGPEDWLARYGPYGFQTGNDKVVGEVPWSNVTVSPHFPSTGQVVAELYPQSGGRPIDGVISVDVEALAALLGVVGPIDTPEVDVTLDETNAAGYLLSDQYELDKALRLDLLESVAREVLGRLLAGEADDPLDLGRALAGPAKEGRVLVWSRNEPEQALFETVGIDGSLLGNPAESSDELRLSLRVANAAANKIDTYLSRTMCIGVSDGAIEVTAQVTNNSPDRSDPDYVFGNRVDLPAGSNRSLVTLHSTTPVSALSVDGVATPAQTQVEAGAFATMIPIDLAPGQTIELRYTIPGVPEQAHLRVYPQPLVQPERWAIADRDTGMCSESTIATRPTTLQQDAEVS